MSEVDEIVRHSEETRRPGIKRPGPTDVWDSLIRTEGDPTPPIKNGAKLFGNSNVGDLGQTNMTSAGQLTSDQTFVVLAIRCWLFFEGTNKRANYLNTAAQLYWTLTVGQKPQFQAPC